MIVFGELSSVGGNRGFSAPHSLNDKTKCFPNVNNLFIYIDMEIEPRIIQHKYNMGKLHILF